MPIVDENKILEAIGKVELSIVGLKNENVQMRQSIKHANDAALAATDAANKATEAARRATKSSHDSAHDLSEHLKEVEPERDAIKKHLESQDGALEKISVDLLKSTSDRDETLALQTKLLQKLVSVPRWVIIAGAVIGSAISSCVINEMQHVVHGPVHASELVK